MRALTGDGESLIMTETGEVSEPQPDHLERIAPSMSYRALIELRQREYDTIRSQRRASLDYQSIQEWRHQTQREHAAYARTLEGVATQLDLGYFVGGNETMAHAIYETVMRLPDDVRAFVCAQVVFLSTGWGQTFHVRNWADKRLVILAHDLPEADVTSIIAHQIVHAWRRHGEGTWGYSVDEEREACATAQAWEFSGSGTVFEPPAEGDVDSMMYIN
jgi:hypothetical protein